MQTLAFANTQIQVVSIKKDKVLVKIEGPELKLSQEYFVFHLDESKKLAFVTVNKLSGTKAVLNIKKGRLKENSSYLLKAHSPSVINETKKFLKKYPLGVELGILQNQIKASINSSVSTNMMGNSWSLQGFLDWFFLEEHRLRVKLGVSSVVAQGVLEFSVCSGTTTCELNITYLNLNTYYQYVINKSNLSYFFSGGIGFYLPVSKSSNVINTAQLSLNQSLEAAVGIEFSKSEKGHYFGSLGYSMFSSSSNVQAQQFGLFAGKVWIF